MLARSVALVVPDLGSRPSTWLSRRPPDSHRLWQLPATLGNGGLLATGDVPDAPRKATSQADAMADQDLRDHQQDDADDVERVRDLWPALVATWQGEDG